MTLGVVLLVALLSLVFGAFGGWLGGTGEPIARQTRKLLGLVEEELAGHEIRLRKREGRAVAERRVQEKHEEKAATEEAVLMARALRKPPVAVGSAGEQVIDLEAAAAEVFRRQGGQG